MKDKKLLAVFMTLWPVIFSAISALFISLELDGALFISLIIFVLFGLVFSIAFTIRTQGAKPQFLAKSNILMLGANAAVFIAEMIWLAVSYYNVYTEESNGAMGGGLLLFLILLICAPHWLTYLFTRICAAINCYRATKDLKAEPFRTLHTLAHMIPIVDLFSAITVFLKVKAYQLCQQPTIDVE